MNQEENKRTWRVIISESKLILIRSRRWIISFISTFKRNLSHLFATFAREDIDQKRLNRGLRPVDNVARRSFTSVERAAFEGKVRGPRRERNLQCATMGHASVTAVNSKGPPLKTAKSPNVRISAKTDASKCNKRHPSRHFVCRAFTLVACALVMTRARDLRTIATCDIRDICVRINLDKEIRSMSGEFLSCKERNLAHTSLEKIPARSITFFPNNTRVFLHFEPV